jgi:hypothetical protein
MRLKAEEWYVHADDGDNSPTARSARTRSI